MLIFIYLFLNVTMENRENIPKLEKKWIKMKCKYMGSGKNIGDDFRADIKRTTINL